MEGEYAGIFVIHCGSHLVKKTTNSNVNEYEYLLCSIMETVDKIINKKNQGPAPHGIYVPGDRKLMNT